MSNIEIKQMVERSKQVFRPNTSKVYYTGRVMKTNTCGNITILGLLAHEEIDPPKHKFYRFLVEFEDGFLAIVCMSNLQKNKVYNPFYPGLDGVGYLGVGDAEGTELVGGKLHDSQEYSTWRGMLQRCYGPNRMTINPSYANVTVADRWKCFQNFWDDIKHLNGYTDWKQHRGEYHLDKDILSGDVKIYSKDTCHFILGFENRSESAKRGNLTGQMYTFTRVSDNYKYTTDDQADFADKTGISRAAINLLVKGHAKCVRGWEVLVENTIQKERLSDKSITNLKNIYLTYYIGTRLKDSYEEEFTVQRAFAQKWELQYKSISACINGSRKSHKGWTFKIKEEKED